MRVKLGDSVSVVSSSITDPMSSRVKFYACVAHLNTYKPMQLKVPETSFVLLSSHPENLQFPSLSRRLWLSLWADVKHFETVKCYENVLYK